MWLKNCEMLGRVANYIPLSARSTPLGANFHFLGIHGKEIRKYGDPQE